MKSLAVRIAVGWSVAAVLVAVPLWIMYDREVRSYLDKELLQVKAAVRGAEAVFRSQTNQAFGDLLRRNGLRHLLTERVASDGDDHAPGSHEALVESGTRAFQTLRSCCGASLHLLDRDGYSLVRFPARGAEGTALAEPWPGLIYLMEGRYGAQGFAVGPSGPGYRRVLPIWVGGQRVGMVEASLHPGELLTLLRRIGDQALVYHLLIREDVVMRQQGRGDAGLFYRATALNPGLLEPLQPRTPPARMPAWMERSDTLTERIRRALPDNGPVTALLTDNRNRKMAVTLAPIRDFRGRAIGYAMATSSADAMQVLFNRLVAVGLLIVLLTGSLITAGILLFHVRHGAVMLREKLAAVTESVGEGVYVVGKDDRIRYVNQAACDMLGYQPPDLLGADAQETFHSDPDGRVISSIGPEMRQAIRMGKTYRRDPEHFRTSSGRLLAVSLTATPLRNAASGEEMVVVFHDVSERARELTSLKVQAMRDPLTGLANRRLLDERLHQEVRRSRRNGSALSLLMADLDNFKIYNDTFGHPAGDLALQRIARVLEGCAHRPSDLICRYGGEEFAILLPDADAVAAAKVAERIRSSVRAAEIVQADGAESEMITISVGTATALAGTPDSDELLAMADRALYGAKALGGNQVVDKAAG